MSGHYFIAPECCVEWRKFEWLLKRQMWRKLRQCFMQSAPRVKAPVRPRLETALPPALERAR
jgi:hypothetical protein